jgi:hypothetical protein
LACLALNLHGAPQFERRHAPYCSKRETRLRI